MAAYHKHKNNPVSERILKEVHGQQAKQFNIVTPKKNDRRNHPTIKSQVNSSFNFEKSFNTTVNGYKGPSIHVSNQKQLKKEMIDPSIAATVFTNENLTKVEAKDVKIPTNTREESRDGKRRGSKNF